ncbi:MAG: signal peptidase I [Terriglobales bacterium]|jgi:signal peptidase I
MASVQSLVVTVVIAVFAITFIVQAFQIPSESMEDTLLIGDYLLVDKVHFGHGGIWRDLLPYAPIRRGDIIVFRYPVHPQQHFVKRVIGLPGDRVRIKAHQVFIDGTPIQEPYTVYKEGGHDSYRDDFPQLSFLSPNMEARWWLQMRSLVHGGELTVPADDYFVMGDNRDQSLDSRYWGFVPRQNIIGMPLLIYWSMRTPERFNSDSHSPGDKLLSFVYTISQFLHAARWKRAFRLIR